MLIPSRDERLTFQSPYGKSNQFAQISGSGRNKQGQENFSAKTCKVGAKMATIKVRNLTWGNIWGKDWIG